MFAAIAIGDLFAAGEVAWIMAIGAILEDMTTNRARKGLKKWIHLTPPKAGESGAERKSWSRRSKSKPVIFCASCLAKPSL